MTEKDMNNTLSSLNEKWMLDFVSETSGDCCDTCGQMRSDEDTRDWSNAKTYLVIKWYFKGMNYQGGFENQTNLLVKYNLPSGLALDSVCDDLELALKDKYAVVNPRNPNMCIKLVKINDLNIN